MSLGAPASRKGERSSSVDHAARALLLFLAHDELRLKDIAHELDVSMTAAFRIVKTLEDRNFLRRDPATKLYRLGPVLLHLAQRASKTKNIVLLCRPYLERLARESGESVYVSMVTSRSRLEYTFMDGVQSTNPVRWVSETGVPLPLGAGTAGKLHLAYFPPDELARALLSMPMTAFTDKTITDRERLAAELETIRKTNVSTSFGERHPEAWGIGVPVWDGKSEPIAGLCVLAPLARWHRDREAHFVQLLREAASELSALLTS